jgi:hypothetical protein
LYAQNSEFQTWLHEEKDLHFNEMSGDKARKYFKKFVSHWNDGKLPKKYYKGITSEELKPADRTRYLFMPQMDVFRLFSLCTL